MIYYNDKFYSDFEDIKEELEDDGLTGDDLIISYQECKLEPMIALKEDDLYGLVENLSFERDTEDGDHFEKAFDVICKHIDFEAINKEMPELWYPQSKEFTIDLNTI